MHQSQIRRAIGVPSLAGEHFVRAGLEVVASAGGAALAHGPDGWRLGEVVLGDDQRVADVLTRMHTAEQLRALLQGPATQVERAIGAFARPA